jgi:2-amino-4-hydroxy-6-hydroxymethyldihydropteridine diphosphokinase
VALGANLGDRLANLRAAADGVRQLGQVPDLSPIYETEPVGGPAGQQAYLNAVLLLRPAAAYARPQLLLDALLRIEQALGRQRRERWGPRLIDLDLLDLGGKVVTTPRLQLPHPQLSQRAFVLAPLCDLDPDWRHPLAGLTACQLLQEAGTQGVRRTELSW